MTWLPDTTNEYGTAVSVLDCEHCPKVVTICPALPTSERPAFVAGWVKREAAP